MRGCYLRRIIASVTLGLIVILASSGCVGQPRDLLGQIRARGLIRIATDPNYAPQSFLTEDGELDGFDIDVAKEIARRLGVKPRFVTPEWDTVMAGNWGARWDIVVESATVTADRKQILYFSDPYYYSPAQFAVRSDLKEVSRIEQFSGRTVCVGKATTYETYLGGKLKLEGETILRQVSGAKIQSLASDAECIQALQAGYQGIDGVLTTQLLIEDSIKSGAPIRKVDDPVFYESLAAAMDKSAPNSASLVEAVSKVIRDMHQDGTLTRLSLKWYSIDLTVKR